MGWVALGGRAVVGGRKLAWRRGLVARKIRSLPARGLRRVARRDEFWQAAAATTRFRWIPKAVVSRLSLYPRGAAPLAGAGRLLAPVSWDGCAGFTDARVRKDLTRFGQFGQPGIGYRCEELAAIRRSGGPTGNGPWR
jgi:hypothetical protein